jgi:hypothetical protein
VDQITLIVGKKTVSQTMSFYVTLTKGIQFVAGKGNQALKSRLLTYVFARMGLPPLYEKKPVRQINLALFESIKPFFAIVGRVAVSDIREPDEAVRHSRAA